jgi:hypothetical protein
MRTTVNIDDHLLAEIKQLAARNHTTMTAVIEDALRQAVAVSKRVAAHKKVRLTTVKGKGPRHGVDLDDSAALLEFMERHK